MKFFNYSLKTNSINLNKYSFFSLLLCVVFCNALYSQEIKSSDIKDIEKYEKALENNIYITGKITDLETLPIVKATIIIEELDINTVTDSNGLYKIDITNIPDSVEQLTLTYKASNFKTINNNLEKSKLTNMFNVVNIEMESNRIFKPHQKITRKTPVHEQVVNKVKTFFRKIR